MTYWYKKLNAFFHDPLHKPLVLGKGHERLGKELFDTYCGAISWESVEASDLIASGADRAVIDNRNKGWLTHADFNIKPEITHPLAPSRLSLDIQKSPDEIHDELKRILQHFPKPSDLFLRFIYLWRVLPEKLSKEPTIGSLWNILPADTRIPDHSVWQHLSLASALSSSLPNPVFLIFSIGPVQEYISQARKTQDLWIGSFILSYIIWNGMKPIISEFGPDAILYPNLYSQPIVDYWLRIEKGISDIEIDNNKLPIASLPNKFVALLQKDRAKEMAEKAKEGINSAWYELGDTVKDYLTRIKGMGDSWYHIWDRQVKDFLESYWVIMPWERGNDAKEKLKPFIEDKTLKKYEDTEGVFKQTNESYLVGGGFYYSLNHLRAQKYLDARKSIRNFPSSEEPGIKCSICGIREVLHDGKVSKDTNIVDLRNSARQFWKKLAPKEERPKEKGKERLCTICAIKRFAGEADTQLKKIWGGKKGFPSTSTMAALPFMIEIAKEPRLKEAISALIEEYKKNESKGVNPFLDWKDLPILANIIAATEETDVEILKEFFSYDGEWLFEESWEEGVPKKLEEFLQKAKEAGIKTPSRFYAILLMDGDNMGKLLSGEGIKTTWQDIFHSDIPDQIKTFAKQAGWDKLINKGRLMGPALHSTISKALTDFSTVIVPWVIEKKFRGKVVYAGGDDLLALLPVADALKAAERLRNLYASTFVKFNEKTGPERVENGRLNLSKDEKLFLLLGGASTLSASIIFAHHKIPLRPLIKEAHRLLNEIAKEKVGRNAFVVSVWKRAGEILQFKSKWVEAEVNYGQVIEEISEMLSDKTLASRLIYTLREEQKIMKNLCYEEKKRVIASYITKSREEKIIEDAERKAEKILALPLNDGLLLARFLAEEGR